MLYRPVSTIRATQSVMMSRLSDQRAGRIELFQAPAFRPASRASSAARGRRRTRCRERHPIADANCPIIERCQIVCVRSFSAGLRTQPIRESPLACRSQMLSPSLSDTRSHTSSRISPLEACQISSCSESPMASVLADASAFQLSSARTRSESDAPTKAAG